MKRLIVVCMLVGIVVMAVDALAAASQSARNPEPAVVGKGRRHPRADHKGKSGERQQLLHLASGQAEGLCPQDQVPYPERKLRHPVPEQGV